MTTAILTRADQLSFPKAICEQLQLEDGQRFEILHKDEVIQCIPLRTAESLRGVLKGANPEGYRDREE